MQNKMIYLYLLLVSLPNISYSLTLDDAITQALQSSPVIQKAKSVTVEAQWKKRESYSGFLPTISANANHLLDKKYALTNIRMGSATVDTIVPQIIPSSQLTLLTTFPIFEGFSSINRYHSSVEQELGYENELSWGQFKIEMDVTYLYYKIIATKILKQVADKNLKVLQDHLKEVKLFKQSGMATNYDVLRVEVQVSNAETDLLNAVDNIAISEQNLAEVIGVENNNLDINGDIPKLKEVIPEQVTFSDIHSRSDIVALKNHISALGFSEKAQGSFWIPRVSLLGQYQYYNNINDSLTDTTNYRSAYQVGVQLNWNIFDGMVSFSRSEQATEQFIQAEKNYRMVELKAQKDFEVGKRRYQYFLNLYRARISDIAKSQESVRLATEGRRVGTRSNSDLLDAEADLYKSEAGAVNAQFGAIEAFINLQTVLGHKI